MKKHGHDGTENIHPTGRWAGGMKLLKRSTTMFLDTDHILKSTQFRGSSSTTKQSDPTEMDEFVELRESLLDT